MIPTFDAGGPSWDLAKETLQDILEIEDPATRSDRLRDLETQSPELADQVRELLQSLESAGDFLVTPTFEVPADVFAAGQSLGGRFVIKRLLGRGGMGEVYEAFDQTLGETVALKTLRREFVWRQDARGLFLAEVQRARKITHANVCRIFDVFELPGSPATPFFSMELVAGPTLQSSAGKISTLPALAVAVQITLGLEEAHRQGIVHRDLKPANVILAPDGDSVRAVLTDFGLAALAAAGEAGIGGTPGYIAPEVLAGRPFTIAGDLYALGRILELLLPGHPIARRCLAENPADRPKSAAQVLAALRPAPLLSRRPVIAALSFAGASGLFGAGAYYRSRRVEWAGRRRLVVNFIEGPAAAPYSQAMLSTALSQSPRFTVVAAEAVTAFQVRQKLKPASPVPPPNWIGLSRELRAAYVLNSSIASRPDGLVWSLELRDAAGGGTAGATEVVESGRSINWVRFADRAALAVRKLAGESGEALEASYVPLSQTTSRSIAAVEAYYEALRRTENSDVSGALVLLDQAISADPNFAMAYHEKARTFSRMSREISALEPSRRAYELRSRVTRYEQLWIEGMYFAFRADDGRALETFRKLVTLYPEDALAWRQFAQSAGYAGRTAEAVEAARTVVGLDSYNPISRSQLAMFLCESGREQEALNLTAVARLEGVNYNSLYWPESQALMGLRRYSESRVQLEMLGRNAAFARLARQRLAALLILEGNLSQAIASLQSDLAGDLETGEEQRPLRTRHWLAMLFNLSGDKGAALKQVRELLKAPVHPAGMEAFRHAGLQACAAGAIPEARMALANMEKVDAEWPASTHIHGTIAHLRGELAMALGQWNEAKAYLIEAAGLWRDPLSLFSLAGAYNGLEDYAAAAGTYSQMAQDRGYLLRRENPAYVPLMWLDQARAAARLSQFDESLRLYSIVTDHWGNSACPPGRAAVREMQSVRNRAKLQATTKGD